MFALSKCIACSLTVVIPGTRVCLSQQYTQQTCSCCCRCWWWWWWWCL